MPEHSLRNCRILVVEDEYMLADELETELSGSGATVVGPAGNLADAMALLHSGEHLDGAVLDVNLGGEMVYPVADLLMARGVPIVLTTGYDRSAIPDRYADVARCEKPVNLRLITAALQSAVNA